MTLTPAECPHGDAACVLVESLLHNECGTCTNCGLEGPIFLAGDASATEIKPHPILCECCGRLVCFDCHNHGWLASGAGRGLLVCPPCFRTCDARSGVFSHRPLKRGREDESAVVAVVDEPNASAAAPLRVIKQEIVGCDEDPKKKKARVIVVCTDDTPTHQTRARRGRQLATRRFMPPLAPPGTALMMMLQNLVFTVDFGVQVRLEHVARALAHRGAELNQRRFCAVVTRTHESPQIARPAYLERLRLLAPSAAPVTHGHIMCGETPPFRSPIADLVRVQELQSPTTRRGRDSRSAVLLFANGHGVCTGTRDLSQARLILSNYARMLRGIGYSEARIKLINIRNMVGSAQLSCRIACRLLARGLSGYASYDEKQFPGVIIKGHPLIKPCTFIVFDSGRVVITGTKSKACADAALARFHPILLHFDINTPPGTPMPSISGEDMAPLDNSVEWALPVTSHDAYIALGVPYTASMRQISGTWKQRMKEVHPDKYPDVTEGSFAHVILTVSTQYIQDLYDLLGDRTRRLYYNSSGQGAPVAPVQHNPIHDDALAIIVQSKKDFATREDYVRYKNPSSAAAAAAAATSISLDDAEHDAAQVAATAATAKVPDLPESDDEDSDDDDGVPGEELDKYIAEALEASDDEEDTDHDS